MPYNFKSFDEILMDSGSISVEKISAMAIIEIARELKAIARQLKRIANAQELAAGYTSPEDD